MAEGVRDEPRHLPAADDVSNTSGSSVQRGRILFVHSEPERLEAFRALLSPDFDVECRESTEISLGDVRDASPEIVLVGSNLLRGDGSALLESLWAIPRTGPTSLVVLVDDDDPEGVTFLELGVDDVIRPGMSARELKARLSRTLRQIRRDRMLVSLAQTDALTGLPNLRWLQLRLREEFRRAHRYRHELAVVIADLDHLKSINDRYGHEVGNRAIQAFAEHLKANLRQVDSAARFGGDEFVVLLPHQTAQEARVFTERLRQGLSQVRVAAPDGQELPIVLTMSAGIADHRSTSGGDEPEALLRAADGALYEAKRAGRNQVWMDARVEH